MQKSAAGKKRSGCTHCKAKSLYWDTIPSSVQAAAALVCHPPLWWVANIAIEYGPRAGELKGTAKRAGNAENMLDRGENLCITNYR